jgi:hypothetical protein
MVVFENRELRTSDYLDLTEMKYIMGGLMKTGVEILDILYCSLNITRMITMRKKRVFM